MGDFDGKVILVTGGATVSARPSPSARPSAAPRR